MFFRLFLFIYVVNAKNIKNIDLPSCKNCIYYKPPIFSDFTTSLAKCEYFGTKNIQSDIIIYDYADSCRKYDDKCGLEGKYFKEAKNIDFKILLHNSLLPNKILTIFLTLYIYFLIKYDL
jgi:hypothetical protein